MAVVARQMIADEMAGLAQGMAHMLRSMAKGRDVGRLPPRRRTMHVALDSVESRQTAFSDLE